MGIADRCYEIPCSDSQNRLAGLSKLRAPLFIDFCTYTAGLEAPFFR